LLLAWRNPYGAALAPAATSPEPDSFALDIALDRTFAARALDATRRGGRALQAFVRQSIDLDNTVTALILAGAESDFMPKQAFLPGGDRVTLAAFEHAVALRDPPAAAHRLAEVLAPSAVAATLRRSRGDASLEDEVLRVRIHELERWSRREPLGPIPVLLFALRLRAQVIDLQRVVWGGALDAPAVDLGAALVTAP
jgi:vacuolar-type H+-ATPase subunit C/Vma6